MKTTTNIDLKMGGWKIRHDIIRELELIDEGSVGSPRRLPVVEYKGKFYFYDERLMQIRNIKNPYDFIELREHE